MEVEQSSCKNFSWNPEACIKEERKLYKTRLQYLYKEIWGASISFCDDECCLCSIVLHSIITRVTLTNLKLNASNNGISILILRKFFHTKMHVNHLIFFWGWLYRASFIRQHNTCKAAPIPLKLFVASVDRPVHSVQWSLLVFRERCFAVIL